MASIGEKIKNIREERKMSLEELALRIRVGKHTIEKYEADEKTPDTQTLLKISTVLDVPASDFAIETGV
ncbi:helix-turn-helix transcriptional regulator [Mesobacillus foraminis]|uniref:helix-turn-helix domain-containing protein n=1 Tax=Mesobacillus foraminis TaxID=279826 RepID=UPI0039A3C131